ncbi:SGNH/GDSL hydrolase family protein [Actinomycetospora sp. NBRC 106378]|uniref:SGNH/GDSL hydrolase family protein n=1 Tax=Actinomycetospora sp. NBRC 106378 TaxID=3032208 RepID=UPI00249FF6CD|nr:SGNH/GDSL hydrolase family protein [Actinomycetospora sp. NBRC 106378]GLZ51531.1 hypothetical protein Acsp07_11480 [Actinomycetospora sp. NBRC 106378]
MAAAVAVVAAVMGVAVSRDAPAPAVAPFPAPPTEVVGATDSIPVAVIGDSISAGTPYGGRGVTNWTALVETAEHWLVTNTAIGGTGYVNAGSAAPFQAAQLERAVAARPRLVVVEGSRNDIGLPPEHVRNAADRLYRELTARLPGTRIVVVGPFWNAGTSTKAFAVRDALASAARDAGATFVDPMAENWFTGAYDGGPLIAADGVHPTDAGHALYARRLQAALDRLGV